MLELANLLVSHNEIREIEQIPRMISYVEDLGSWNKISIDAYNLDKGKSRPAQLIAITEFEDGKMMVHDGHHRCVATVLGGRNYLRADEYTVAKWKYDEYNVINFEQNWVTPFDPRTEARVGNFFEFKNFALRLGAIDERLSLEFIRIGRRLYCCPRQYYTVKELAKAYRPAIFRLKQMESLV